MKNIQFVEAVNHSVTEAINNINKDCSLRRDTLKSPCLHCIYNVKSYEGKFRCLRETLRDYLRQYKESANNKQL